MLGMGSSTFTASPPYSMSAEPTSSDPPEKPAAGRMGHAKQQHQHEDGHLGQRGHAEVGAADHGGPRKEEGRVNREDNVEERIEEVADIGLRPALADGVDTTFIRRELHRGGRTRSKYETSSHRCHEEEHACQNDSSNSQVRGHAGQPNQWRLTSLREVPPGRQRPTRESRWPSHPSSLSDTR